MMGRILRIHALATLILFPLVVQATAIDSYEFQRAEEQQRFLRLTSEIRCPKCQNQSIADSNAPISDDLRREVYRLIQEGRDDGVIVDFMLARYGEFVLYKPPLNVNTLFLWFGPFLLLLIGLSALIRMLKRHRPTSQPVELNREEQAELGKILEGKQ